MSHALLLRLFLSPYFTISVAMHYLKTYPESIGISHYLCWRMKHMRAEEVEFYWPQICHLLITRPTESNALESFVVERAEESTHSAMLTFWFMQAALRDLIHTRSTNPRPFMICQRVLHRCHEIIFGDAPDPSQSPYQSLPATPYGSTAALSRTPTGTGGAARLGEAARKAAVGLRDRVRQPKVNAHIPAALVGMGVILAGTPGMPGLVDLTGQVAVTQGRRPRDDLDDTRKRIEIARNEGSEGPRGGEDVMARINGKTATMSDDSETEAGTSREAISRGPDSAQLDRLPSDPGLNQTSGPTIKLHLPPKRPLGRTLSSRNDSSVNLGLQSHHPSHTSPSLIQVSSPFESTKALPSALASKVSDGSPKINTASPMRSPRRPSSAANFRKNSGLAPFHSSPSLSGQRSDPGPLRMPMPSAESLLGMYEQDTQRTLLRSHYCRSEFRFLSALEDISTRLLVIPKPARLSALRAELTGLNHSLPAEVCMPLWCPADHSHEDGGETRNGNSLLGRRDREPDTRVRGHHRIVRISPGDSVVLNSAQKVPYLLHLEILEDDLDFDPTRRPNRELLKKIVVQEEYKKRKREGIETIESGPRGKVDGLGWSSINLGSGGSHYVETRPAGRPTVSPRQSSTPASPVLRREHSEPLSKDEPEEVDLIEQIFGADYSSKNRKANLADSLPVPIAPRNKHLDAAAWSRADSTSSPPQPTSLISQPPTPPPDSPTPGGSVATTGADSNITSSIPPQSYNPRPVITLEDYSERMRTAAVMLAQLNASMKPEKAAQSSIQNEVGVVPGKGIVHGSLSGTESLVDGSIPTTPVPASTRMKLNPIQATAIRDRIMQEMMSLEEERVSRMTAQPEGFTVQPSHSDGKTAEDESIIRRELNKEDPSAMIFKESWNAKKSRIQAASPWGHLAKWNVLSVIVKTGDDLRQEQLATQLIQRFGQIWKEEQCDCWVRFFRILVTGDSSGLMETITDAVSVHSIKKAEYARRMTTGALGNVTLMDYFVQTYGDPQSGRFAKAQRNFIKSLAAYSVITFLLQIKDRHNGNILIDRDGHLIHIDFGFMLSNSPGGNMRFEAAPFKLTMDYVDIMGGLDSPGFAQFKRLFKEGFEAARKHSDSIITMVELMQRDSKLDCFQMYGEQTATHLRERFQLGLTTQAVDAYMERLILTSVGSSWTRLYDSYQYYHEGVL